MTDDQLKAKKIRELLKLHNEALYAGDWIAEVGIPALDDIYEEYFLARFQAELEAMQPLMSPSGYEKFRKTALALAEKAAGLQ